VDELHNAGKHGGIGFRRYSMAKVAHVPRGAGAGSDDFPDVRLQHFPGCRKQRGIDVALQWNRPAQASVGFIQGQSVIDADNIHADITHGDQELGGSGSEMDQRRTKPATWSSARVEAGATYLV